jgi:hypothetical protein
MMIVQSGKQRATTRFDQLLTVPQFKVRLDLNDASVCKANIAAHSIDFGLSNQHRRSSTA